MIRAAWVAVLFLLAAPVRAELDTEPLEGRVIAIAGDHIEIAVDIGGTQLKGDDLGVIKRNGVEIGLAVVVFVDIGHTTMRVVSKSIPGDLLSGDSVFFDKGRTARGPLPAPDFSATPGANFVPLLAPVNMPKTALTRTANVFHGRMRGSHLYQTLNINNAWYSASRLDLDGSIERIHGEPWSLVWSANARYRDGSVLSTSEDFRHPKPHLYRLTLSRKSLDGGFLRIGRIFPMELPAVGYLDGGQFEKAVTQGVRLGAAAGLRPNRLDQGFSGAESAAAAYGTLEKGTFRQLYYSGTLGLLHTRLHGKPDELAALLDQRTDLGPKLNLIASSQVDFDAGAAVQRKKPRLTRQDLTANSPATSWLSFTGGASHYEPLDVAAERELAGGSDFYLNNGYWRYWTGSGQTLPGAIQLDEQLSWTHSQARFGSGLWRVGVSRRGLGSFAAAFLNLSVYNLYNPLGPDYGGTFSATVPFFSERLSLDASASMRYGPTEDGMLRRAALSDFSARATCRISQGWLADLGLTRGYQAQIRSTTVNGGLSYRW